MAAALASKFPAQLFGSFDEFARHNYTINLPGKPKIGIFLGWPEKAVYALANRVVLEGVDSPVMGRLNGIPRDEEGEVPQLEVITAQSPL